MESQIFEAASFPDGSRWMDSGWLFPKLMLKQQPQQPQQQQQNNRISISNAGSETIQFLYCLLPVESGECCECDLLYETRQFCKFSIKRGGSNLKFGRVILRPQTMKNLSFCPQSNLLLALKTVGELDELENGDLWESGVDIQDFIVAVNGNSRERIHLIAAGTRALNPVLLDFSFMGKKRLKKEVSSLGRLKTLKLPLESADSSSSSSSSSSLLNVASLSRLQTRKPLASSSKEPSKPTGKWNQITEEAFEMGKEIVKGVAVELAQDTLSQLLSSLVLGA